MLTPGGGKDLWFAVSCFLDGGRKIRKNQMRKLAPDLIGQKNRGMDGKCKGVGYMER